MSDKNSLVRLGRGWSKTGIDEVRHLDREVPLIAYNCGRGPGRRLSEFSANLARRASDTAALNRLGFDEASTMTPGIKPEEVQSLRVVAWRAGDVDVSSIELCWVDPVGFRISSGQSVDTGDNAPR